MDLKLFVTVFITIFLAEVGNETQLARVLYAADARTSHLLVLAAAASALVVTFALGALAGGLIGTYVSERTLQWLAGLGVMGVGLWVLVRA